MPPLRGEDELSKYKLVLEEAGRFAGLVEWKQIAAEAVREHLSNHSQRAIELLMYQHRNEVRQIPEDRFEYREFYSYHYDFRIPIDGELIYIETVFEPGRTDAESTIRVVRIKPANPDHPWTTTRP